MGQTLDPLLNRFLLINAVCFVTLFLLDFFSPPGRWLPAVAAVVLAWNGGCFFRAGLAGRLPWDRGPGFALPARYLLMGAGAACLLGSLAAAVLAVA